MLFSVFSNNYSFVDSFSFCFYYSFNSIVSRLKAMSNTFLYMLFRNFSNSRFSITDGNYRPKNLLTILSHAHAHINYGHSYSLTSSFSLLLFSVDQKLIWKFTHKGSTIFSINFSFQWKFSTLAQPSVLLNWGAEEEKNILAYIVWDWNECSIHKVLGTSNIFDCFSIKSIW